MREGVAPISARGFYNHFANGEHGQRMYDDVNFIRGIEIVSEIDKLIAANDDSISRCASGSEQTDMIRNMMRRVVLEPHTAPSFLRKPFATYNGVARHVQCKTFVFFNC